MYSVCVPEGVGRERERSTVKSVYSSHKAAAGPLYNCTEPSQCSRAKSCHFAFNCKDGNRFVSTVKGGEKTETREPRPRGNGV